MTSTPAAPAGTASVRPPTVAPARRRLSDFSCKQVMAWTGLVFGLFVLVHMVGNLKAYLGPQEFDSYAMWLRHVLEPAAPYSSVLWAIRVVLLACLVGHVVCAYILWRRARAVVQPPPVRLAKVSCLASCRQDWLIDAATIREIRSRTGDLTGSTIAEASQRRDPAASVRRFPV
jgi:hypothetical protein